MGKHQDRLQPSFFEDHGVNQQAPPLPLTAVSNEHLLKVADAVNHDAIQVWMDLWAQFRPHVSPNGVVQPDMARGFVPACGWEEFLERFWLLKHYLDSVSRVCQHK